MTENEIRGGTRAALIFDFLSEDESEEFVRVSEPVVFAHGDFYAEDGTARLRRALGWLLQD